MKCLKTPTIFGGQQHYQISKIYKTSRHNFWSESTQNVVRNDISNGRYESQSGQTLTSYFLGKVCLARNLEPRIPEESLVIQLSYHYEDAIQKARKCSQVKTIQGMASLLEDHEHEGQYR